MLAMVSKKLDSCADPNVSTAVYLPQLGALNGDLGLLYTLISLSLSLIKCVRMISPTLKSANGRTKRTANDTIRTS